MKYLKKLLQNLWKVLSSHNWYREQHKKDSSENIAFILVSLGLIGVIHAGQFYFDAWKKITSQITEIGHETLEKFPENLTLTWSNQTFSYTPPEVVSVPYPQSLSTQQTHPLAFLSPTASHTATLKENAAQSTLLIVSPDQVLINDGQGDWTESQWKNLRLPVQDLTITKQTLPALFTQFEKYVAENQLFILGAIWIIGPLLFVVSKLWLALLDTAIIYFFWYISGQRWPFSRVYILTLLVTLPAEIIVIIAQLIYGPINFPLGAITYWICLIGVVLYQSYQDRSLKS
jgi:hypothetical protein